MDCFYQRIRHGARSKKAPGRTLFSRDSPTKKTCLTFGKQGANIVIIQPFVPAAGDQPNVGNTPCTGPDRCKALVKASRFVALESLMN